MDKKNSKRIVVALGGNALGNNLAEQMEQAQIAAKAIVDLIEAGHSVVLVHGNGPQVGMIETAFEVAAQADDSFPVLPMSVCVALSQGYIGYDLQNVLTCELFSRGLGKVQVVTIITQVKVDPDDPAFENPTKPIGTFMSEDEAKALEAEGVAVKEDSGRGWRRVVASPKPVKVIEAQSIRALMDAGQVPITCGGGGIPVALFDGKYHGQAAVIDKDFSAAKLAELIDADMLIILTAVEKVAINFGSPQQQDLDRISTKEARAYIAGGEFGKGSMEPKVQAACAFVSSGPNKEALITELSVAKDALEGKTGTRIVL